MTMKFKTSNARCRGFVNARKDFQANNIFSETWRGVYIVYSYGHHFPVYVWKNGKWYGNSDKYSVTTSKHQNQAGPDGDITYMSTEELKKLIEY